MADKKTDKASTLIVKQIGSPIRREKKHHEYLKSLGLGKMNRVRELQDTPSVRGLIVKAAHMIEIIEKK
jgi:large subunit ribosomal protein L30